MQFPFFRYFDTSNIRLYLISVQGRIQTFQNEGGGARGLRGDGG